MGNAVIKHCIPMNNPRKDKVLIVYTGGTIGMVRDEHGALQPFAMDRIYEAVPALCQLPYHIDSIQLDNIVDSSNMSPRLWVDIADVIAREYDRYDGFVVLHGTDTMAYTASALSFMFQNLSKPVVLTGSQLPLGMIRSDGSDNIICALEIASQRHVTIPEVCIFFQSSLLRGNRSTKVSADNFNAFSSYNYPALAQVGIDFHFQPNFFLPMPDKPLQVHRDFDRHIAVLKLFPGIMPEVVRAVVQAPGLRGIVIETYGSGNAPTEAWFLDCLRDAIARGIVLLDVTQCKSGAVKLGQYAAGYTLEQIGVIGGHDITIEAAVTKMMYLLACCGDDTARLYRLLASNLRGELSYCDMTVEA